MITPRKSRKNQGIQPQVVSDDMNPASLAKRIFSHGITDYFQVYFCVNGESLLSLADLFCLGGA
jgi:hypothetical protein